MDKRSIWFFSSLSIWIIVLVLLVTGSSILMIPLDVNSTIPLGTFITWIGLVALPLSIYWGIKELRDPTVNLNKYLAIILRIMLALAILWVPICYLLAGNISFSFTEKATFQGGQLAMKWFWRFSYGIVLGPILLLATYWISKLVRKKINLLFTLLFLLSLMGCSNQFDEEQDLQNRNTPKRYIQHLDYLINLKNDVASIYWPEFSDEAIFLPVVYYTKQGTYVLNPNDHIRSITDHEEVGLLSYHTPIISLPETYTDTTNFQFSSSYSSTDSTSLYFQENVLSFQSFKLTQQFIPDVADIQDWSIMVIHELFHGYQRSVPAHRSYYTDLEIPEGPDQFLGAYHDNHDWYRESVNRENDILKSIWMENADLVSHLTLYDSLRNARIDRIKREFGVDIREIEDYEMMVEGHARYFESLCKRFLTNNTSNTRMLEEEDLSLITNRFEQYAVTKDKGLFDIFNNRYYYPLGFNISMILEKHLPEYMETIYVKEQSFNTYLQALKAHPKE